MSNYSFDSEFARQAIIPGSWRSDSAASCKPACHCVASTQRLGSNWTLFLQGRPRNRYGSLNQFPLQWPHTQIAFFCATLDKRLSWSFSAVCLSAPKLLLICLTWSSRYRQPYFTLSESASNNPTALISFDFIQSISGEGGWNSDVSLSSLGLCF